MFKRSILLTAVSLVFSSNVLAKVETFPAASFCGENITKRNEAFQKLLKQEGNAEKAMQRLVTEQVGRDARSHAFVYNPSFERSTRQFTCSIPLSDEIGKFKVNVHAHVQGMNPGRPGGCEFSRARRVHDGSDWKVFAFNSGGFWWSDLQQNDGFVNFSQDMDNEYERSSSLQLTCRTTWDQGIIKLQHIELEY